MIEILHYLKDPRLDYGNYGIFLIMGNAGFCNGTTTFQHDNGYGLSPCLGAGVWERMGLVDGSLHHTILIAVIGTITCSLMITLYPKS